MPGGTQAFWMLSSDYNVLRSTVIAMKNFIQYTHCQAVQPFRLTLFLIKALSTIISKHIVSLALGFQTKVLASNSSNESNTFFKLFLLK